MRFASHKELEAERVLLSSLMMAYDIRAGHCLKYGGERAARVGKHRFWKLKTDPERCLLQYVGDASSVVRGLAGLLGWVEETAEAAKTAENGAGG